MPHFIKLHLTTLDERLKAGRQGEPATGSEHLLVGMKIAIPVLPSKVSYTGVDARSCVNDDCLHWRPLQIAKFQSGKKSDIGDFEPYAIKRLHYMKNWKHEQVEACLRQIFWTRAYVEDGDKEVYFSPDLVGTYSVFQAFAARFSKWWLQMPTTGMA